MLAFCASLWGHCIQVCAALYSEVPETAVKPAVCHPFRENQRVPCLCKVPRTRSLAPTPRGESLPGAPSLTADKIDKKHQQRRDYKDASKKLLCLSPRMVDPAELWWVWSPKRRSLCSGNAWVSTKEMKRRNKTSEQPNLVWTACIHYGKDGFLLGPPPYPPPQWWQQEAWHSNYRIFMLNREEGQLASGRRLG